MHTDQRKPALLVDGLIPPKTVFHNEIRLIDPEFAGYGVLLFPATVNDPEEPRKDADGTNPFHADGF